MELSVTITVDASPLEIWPYFVDFDKRRLWELDLQKLAYNDPVDEGTTGTMKLAGMPAMGFTVVRSIPGESFWDRTDIPGGSLLFKHDLAQIDGITHLTQAVRLEKPDFTGDDVGFLTNVFADTPAAAWRLKALVEP